MSALPVEALTDLSVMAATARTWPTFSAMSTSTTGRNIAIADQVPADAKSARWKVGSPIQSAFSTAERSSSPSSAAAM